MPVFWWVELSLFPLVWRAMSDCVFWGVCELSMTLDSQCAYGWVCVLVLFVASCEASIAGSCWQLSGAGPWIQIEASVRALGDLSSLGLGIL